MNTRSKRNEGGRGAARSNKSQGSALRGKKSQSKGKSQSKERGPSKDKSSSKEKVIKQKGKYVDFKDRQRKGDPLPSFNDDAIRLNKYLSNAGVCSRREADVLIQTGVVTVNGKIITEMGFKVAPTDVVKYDGESINAETKRYVLLNKPKGFITTMADPMGRKTVMGLVKKACKERIYPVGRLDKETTGLMLFTNDGDLAKKLTHPKHRASKLYLVELNRKIGSDDIAKLLKGVQMEDGTSKFDKVEYVEDGDSRVLGVELHSGKNQIVRRTFSAIGFTVTKLDRMMFAGLTKKDLPRGYYRHLTENEIAFLKMK
ncbi:MAG: rRNA pseudouridine synthase [Crocinitomicaceae bacterium]|nr:rRNA pseudouridine synthase [Crocinitomicaceae bacterium]